MQSNITMYSSQPDSISKSLKKLWKYKSLIWVFAKRDMKVKYSQTYLGIVWSLLKPLISLFIYAFFFGFILKWNTGDTPYAVYVLSGLIGWNLFSYIVNKGVAALHESSDLIKKVYFPKAILPLSAMVVGTVEAMISLLLIIPIMVYYNIWLSWKITLIPLVLLFNVICGLSITFIISAFSIKKKDILQVLPFILNMAIWFTPVFLSIDVFPEQMHFLFSINPIGSVIDLWRWTLLDRGDFQITWLLNFFVTSILLLGSFYLYVSKEDKFADFI